MFQCSLFVEKHCSDSNLKNGDGEVVGMGFWSVFSLKLALKKPLEIHQFFCELIIKILWT